MVRVRGQANVAAVENRGRFLRLAEPGINFFNPCAGELVARTLSTRVPSLETKTKDNVFVQLICTIQYRVVKENADEAFYKLQNPPTANSVLRL
ncbi:hypersensitive-induced response protein 4-like isoform X2 [Aegilops tauschii subsp. strangulata]|uniref:hypersensitive-induced response protein 4-like isoform X2 n=1 Tax=Aegilops tauschii subsp. strangulata TaxID=200361 RepID=UPI003CC8AA74